MAVRFDYCLPCDHMMKDWIVDCSNCNRRSARNQKPSSKGGVQSCDSVLADSRFQLDLEISLSGFPAPNAFGVETSGHVIEDVPNKSKNNCRPK